MTERLWIAGLATLISALVMVLLIGMLGDGGALDQIVELQHETARFSHAAQ